MSFQKAHQISNELGEVVVTSLEVDLNTTATVPLAVPAPYKNYRVLELGFVVSEAGAIAETTALRFKCGVPADDNCFIDTISALTIAASPLGLRFNTNKDFDFRDAPSVPAVAGDSARVDLDGVPFLSAGDVIKFVISTGAGISTQAVFYARLAPNIEYKG